MGIMYKSIVYNQDYRQGLKKTPDKYYDLLIADIPYGINVGKMSYLSETKTTIKQKNGKRINGNGSKEPYTLKEWDSECPKQDYFDEVCRVSKNQIIFGVEYVDWIGLGDGRIKWNKGFAEGVSFKPYEMAYCSFIVNTYEFDLLWAGMCQAKSLKEPMVQQGNKKLNEKRIHPCYKPRLLYKKLLYEFGFKGMKLLDTHVGGGAIRIEADLFGCDFVGYEIDQEYFLKQEEVYNNFKRQKRLEL
jgi:site-specific DNA-methyltransferase (adenine-specific)